MITRRDMLRSAALVPFGVLGANAIASESKVLCEAKPNFKVGHFAKRKNKLVRIKFITETCVYFEGENYDEEFGIHWGWHKDVCEPVNFEVGSKVTVDWYHFSLMGQTIIPKFTIKELCDKSVTLEYEGSSNPRELLVDVMLSEITPVVES